MSAKISSTAVVETSDIGENVTVSEYAIIRPNVTIGNNVIIHPFVVIESGVEIGDNVEIFPGTYIGKTPKGAGALVRQPHYEGFVIIGDNCLVGPNAVIYYDVKVGHNTLIGDGTSVREQCIIGSYCVIGRYVTVNYNTHVGDRTKIMDLAHITGNCYIGSDVFISMCVSMANDNSFGRLGYEEQRIKGPHIEDKVCIGVGASLLPGVYIGKSAIIGGGSVVSRDVPDFAVVMGVPAKIVRYNKQVEEE